MSALRFCILVLLFVINTTLLVGQQRTIEAIRTESNIKIDAFFDEPIWEKAAINSGFLTAEPIPKGKPNGDTEVKIIYDNTAVYIAAKMFDPEPDKILKPYSTRDETQNASWFGVTFDTYQNGVNGVAFLLTAAGVQVDLQLSADEGDDDSWDAVWESDVRITDYGWAAELKIPFAALRFPEKSIQEWNIQFGRQTRRLRESSFWNALDPDIDGFINQCGILTGIKDVKPPVRLSFTPFVVGGLTQTKNADGTFNSSLYGAGMDMKLGINDAFTLDMTLVPDFSNTVSDQQVLNLSPFEVFFEENRQFFTEGTELFNKGNFFYSRRIGAAPVNQGLAEELEQNEELVDNPSTNQLINATKISGRTERGLGVGFFNAIERKSEATILNNATGTERKVTTNPLTNYNVLVLDQNLKNNSYISLINTNVLRKGETYDANVTGTVFRFQDKNQKFRLNGKAALSQLIDQEQSELGHTYYIEAAKTGGKWNYGISYVEESDTYNPNDLGFLFNNNERSTEIELSYNEYEPIGKFNRYEGWMELEYSRLYDPNVFTDFAINTNWFALTKKFFAFGVFGRLEPVKTFDYFEPRTADLSKYYAFPTNFTINPFISTDYSKRIAVDFGFNYRVFSEDQRQNISVFFSPRMRVNDWLNFIINFNYNYRNNDVGFVNKDNVENEIVGLNNDDVMFGVRNRTLIENSIRAQLVFNEKMFLNLRLRHYWDRVAYQRFTRLESDGTLTNLAFDGNDELGNVLFDTDFDLFNIDLNFTWRFAPGSDILLTWKNNGFYEQNEVSKGYFNAIRNVYNQSQSNEITLKVLYFLDYSYLTKKK